MLKNKKTSKTIKKAVIKAVKEVASGPPLVGAFAPNFYQGSRSEMLAQYVFSAMGPVIPIPRPADTGLDLHCSVIEQVGGRGWPIAYYAVQVKSDMSPWVFDNVRSIQWLLEQPVPVFLCVVLKNEGRLRLYHTLPRYHLWSRPPLPPRIELVPTEDHHGTFIAWGGGDTFSLSAPILDIALADTLADDFVPNTRSLMRFWIDVDFENLRRTATHLRWVRMPLHYTTNVLPVPAWLSNQYQANLPAIHVEAAILNAIEALQWIGGWMCQNGQRELALRIAFLISQLSIHGPDQLGPVIINLHQALGLPHDAPWHQGLDQLNAAVNALLPPELQFVAPRPA